MSVSNEDRETSASIAAITLADGESTEAKYFISDAHRIVDALIAHGWGPKPTVTRDAIVDHVARLEVPQAPVVNGVLTVNTESMADALIPFLRECGIEVTS